jgi:hypothetical protein
MPPKDVPDVRADPPLPHDTPQEPRDDDPLRQLFRRHANHYVIGARARQMQSRIRHKLFAGEPDPIG